MSPTKRGLINESDKSRFPPKRLRGGGFDEEDLYDDDLLMEEAPQPEDDDLLQDDNDNSDFLQNNNDASRRWRRPPLTSADNNNAKDLSVQWIDMDVVSGQALTRNPNHSRTAVVGSTLGHHVPILRCYGVNQDGHSVATFIHGYTPYCYFALPPGSTLDEDDHNPLEEIRAQLTVHLQNATRGASASASAQVVGVELCRNLRSIMGYETVHTQFLKVYVSLPGLVPTLRRIMEDGLVLPWMAEDNSQKMNVSFAPFECNVPFVLRFMVDHDISGAGWLSLPAHTYQVREAARKETHCQVCTVAGLQSVPLCPDFVIGVVSLNHTWHTD